MKKTDPTTSRKPIETPRDKASVERADEHNPRAGYDDFEPTIDLPGKIDSGPEPDVFGMEIPPQR